MSGLPVELTVSVQCPSTLKCFSAGMQIYFLKFTAQTCHFQVGFRWQSVRWKTNVHILKTSLGKSRKETRKDQDTMGMLTKLFGHEEKTP